MSEKILYTSNEIEAINNQDVVFIDIRDKEDFEKGHIPGATNIPEIFYFLSTSTDDGLDELKSVYTELFSKAGLSSDKMVIIYEDNLNTRYGASCRGFWLLKYLGHQHVGILKGGYSQWQKSGNPITTDTEKVNPCDFIVNINRSIMATKDTVLTAINNDDIVLLDNRDKVEWVGESSSPYGIDFAPRKGRIPGAVWIEWYEFMDDNNSIASFKSNEEIKELCAQKGIYTDSEIIIYCFKGARASNTYVAMHQAGFHNLKVYFGSWNEWSRDLSLPIDSEKIELSLSQ